MAMKEEESWVVDIEKRADSLDRSTEEETWKKPSIYRVPAFARDLNPKSFTPQVVSFGPFHHGADHLKPMEKHKRRALIHFLKRAGRPLSDFNTALSDPGVLQELQHSYASLGEEWRRDPDRFLKLMILDGCFMLEVVSISNNKQDYAPNDPLFSDHGVRHKMPYIRKDMLIVENQLPLLVLKILVVVANGRQSHAVNGQVINELLLKFVEPEAKVQTTSLGLHVLDIYRQSMLNNPAAAAADNCSTNGGGRIRSAVELHEAGVDFSKSESNSLSDIRFKDGVLYLPAILVDDTTECTYLNLVVFEHLHVGTGNEVTSYLFFMDEIIDTARDVGLLHSRKIIENGLGSDKAVAELFNSLSKEVTLDPRNRLGEVRWAVNQYCGKNWNRWRANLLHTYFRSPWSLLSLATAILLIILTLIQTLYAILPYYHPT